ncbi:MAG TPA: S8 family serine peptidase, partial [Streptosporangiaceae bacterium]|nr:S8 family serine peptidase [Streptosporangiaceae bacterium]
MLAGLTIATPAVPATAATAAGRLAARPAAAADLPKPTLAYQHLDLPHGEWAQVYSDGLAEVFSPAGQTEFRHVPLLNSDASAGPASVGELPSRGALMADLSQDVPQPYASNEVVVVYNSAAAPPQTVLNEIGADKAQPMFATATQQRLEQMRAAAEKQTGGTLLDFPAAVRLHLRGTTSVAIAVARLRASSAVSFAEPDWTVTSTDITPVPVTATSAPLKARSLAATAGVPGNYTLTSSAQSLLNSPAVNAVPAFADLAQRYGQLPGQGETITNVSLGTLDDASTAASSVDPCRFDAAAFGPTTIVQNGQRYLDLPTMPLIPTYTASSAGVLDPTGETCGDDEQLTEVGLDFSMMAPLPDQLQRSGETGSGLTDLLGIAPGANYRLVVPAAHGGAITDVDAAFIAAATQSPAPDVITASLGFGLDQEGLASRYLEDDPLTSAILTAITGIGIVVCVSAGDGLRTFTNAPVSPSGGAVATNAVASWNRTTDFSDIALSSVPSRDLDSGAIDVGGTTLNDIFTAPPDNLANSASAYLQAYPATRFNGARNYSSGFGSRVNLSAPGDNVLSFEHAFGGGPDAITEVTEGGTSAAAPQVAAAAAIILQVARLTGDGEFAGHPLTLRKFLVKTGSPVGAVPESDLPISVGPQVNVGSAVETLLARAGVVPQPGVARVAIVQRQQNSALGGGIHTATDPANISLTGRLANAWIT